MKKSNAALAVAGLLISALAPRLAAQSISTYSPTQAKEARIDVQTATRAPFRIPRTVYGSFLEDILSSVFGGISAQIIDNPSFESYEASLDTLVDRFTSSFLKTPDPFRVSTSIGLPLPWLPLRQTDGWRYEPRWGNAANSERYIYVMGLPDREVGIRQAVYLPIEREREYQGSLFASSAEGAAEVNVSFRRKNAPDEVLASARVAIPGEAAAAASYGVPNWHKLSFKLELAAGAVAPLEAVDFVVSVPDNHRISLDEIRLYPLDAIHGLDPDVIRTAKGLKTGIIRYGGNFTSGYHWRDGVGPLDERRTMLNQSWGFPEYNEVGTDEFMDFCDQVGAPAQICLNLGSGTAREAHDWVEYCQGGPDTPEGKHRAANGHPAPYNVGAWELGNELWGADWEIGWYTPRDYAERYHTVYNAIRDLVPAKTMIFANGGDVDSYHDWNATLLEKDGPELSYLTTHYVVDTNDLPRQGPSREYAWDAAFAQPIGVAKGLDAMRAQIDANSATRGRVKLAYTEWMFGGSDKSDFPRFDNLGGAVIAGSWLNMLLSHADFIPVADMTGIIDVAGMHKKRGRVFVTPQFWTLWLYSNFAGDTPVSTHTEVREYDSPAGPGKLPATPHVPYLDVLATVESNPNTLALFVVNRDWKQAIPATIRLADFTPASDVTVRTLTGDSVLGHNDEESPNTVHPTSTNITASGNELRYEFPKHSVTVLEFSPK